MCVWNWKCPSGSTNRTIRIFHFRKYQLIHILASCSASYDFRHSWKCIWNISSAQRVKFSTQILLATHTRLRAIGGEIMIRRLWRRGAFESILMLSMFLHRKNQHKKHLSSLILLKTRAQYERMINWLMSRSERR
jgi:hypothetical protein